MFTVPDNIEEVIYMELPDGRFRGRLKSLEKKDKGYGEFLLLKWKILEPVEFIDWTKADFFNVGASDPYKQQKAVAAVAMLCRDVFLLKPGEVLTQDKAIGKEAWLTIESKHGDDGKRYRNIVKREPVTDGDDLSFDTPPSTIMYGNIAVPNPAVSGVLSTLPINDEVPF